MWTKPTSPNFKISSEFLPSFLFPNSKKDKNKLHIKGICFIATLRYFVYNTVKICYHWTCKPSFLSFFFTSFAAIFRQGTRIHPLRPSFVTIFQDHLVFDLDLKRHCLPTFSQNPTRASPIEHARSGKSKQPDVCPENLELNIPCLIPPSFIPGSDAECRSQRGTLRLVWHLQTILNPVVADLAVQKIIFLVS